jgi:hypothetical protein
MPRGELVLGIAQQAFKFFDSLFEFARRRAAAFLRGIQTPKQAVVGGAEGFNFVFDYT